MIFGPESLYNHALHIRDKYDDNPVYIVNYLSELLKNNMPDDSSDPFIEKTRKIILDYTENEKSSESIHSDDKNEDLEAALEKASREIKFRREIEEYYLPKQLVNAIMELGHIPEKSIETNIGIAFIDLVDYSYISKFLSPMENQSVLNGLFSAFNWILRRHSGYLNKIEGDSMMFHFGGLTDPVTRSMEDKEGQLYIAKELFHTCVEMQRACFLFNQADDSFLEGDVSDETTAAISRAFDIISNLRNSFELSYSMNALFQIRIRIGANIGDVTLGNFGPDGAKQWDVIGLPVIEAKRMESTAPIGGLRISKKYFDLLKETGVVDAYYNQFKQDAQIQMGYFKDISLDELFSYKKVLLKDKKNAVFESYSVQVNPALPEALSAQVRIFLTKGVTGIDRIIELLEYYRGNKFVISAIESVFIQKGLHIRKEEILKTMYPEKYQIFLEKLDLDDEKVKKFIRETYTLFDLFCKLGSYQDRINAIPNNDFDSSGFLNYSQYFDNSQKTILDFFDEKKLSVFYRTYFYDMLYPSFFLHIKASIYEYLSENELDEDIEEVEEVLEEL